MSATTVRNSLVRLPEVAEAANERLRNSPYPALRGVTCECDQGVLLLRGHLRSFYHKQLAQEAVVRLRGVDAVINEIEVA